ncbi:MAG: hypothetical protein HY810_07505 [Candidatus Omnitrophica bacterium]|nr:hypothetical protein [Candidatus Omnitrophota bacterium]
MGRVVLVGFLIFLFFGGVAFAIPSEGDFLPALHKSIWGAQFNHIFLRDFNKVEGKASTTQYFISASYGLTERLFLDGKVGMGSVSFDRNDDISLDFSAGFAGGYGFRYLWYEDKSSGFKSILGFQHISCHPFKDTVNDVKHRVIWDEWQMSLLGIKEWEKAALYAGVQYSEVQLKYKVDDFRRRLKSEDIWGVFFGANYSFNDRVSFNTEARLLDEWGVNLGVCYKY